MASSQRSKHLSLIDNGINDIWSLSLPAHLESLNLHGNYIRHICNLSHLIGLVHLDLSANQISVIDGLERLTSLKTLNLSCNIISDVDNLSGLRSLERLNLSYNQIEDVKGLSHFSGPASHLHYLALHGNKLRSIDHLVASLKDVKTLQSLVLFQDGSGNPLCHSQGYVEEVWVNLPQLHDLNNMDRSGRLNRDVDAISNIPGLEAYLDFLLQHEKVQTSESTHKPFLITPKIDAVMEKFKQKYAQGTDMTSSTSKSAFSSSSPTSDNCQHTRNMRKILKEREFVSPVDEGNSFQHKVEMREPSSDDPDEPVRDKEEAKKHLHGESNIQNKRGAKPKVASVKDKIKK